MARDELKLVLEMLRSSSVEEKFLLLRASSLLSELRSAVSTIDTSATASGGTNLNLMCGARSLAASLRELLKVVLEQNIINAELWYQMPAVFYRNWSFRSATIREAKQFLHMFETHFARYKVSSYVKEKISSSFGPFQSKKELRQPIVGRSNLVEKIVKTLLVDRVSPDSRLVIPIIGGPGIGKSHLAMALIDDVRVKLKFPARFWIPVTSQCSLEHILLMMVSRKTRAQDGISITGLLHHVQRKLRRHNYLIVLDDVWCDEERISGLEIRPLIEALPSNGIIVLTTRTPGVASEIAKIPGTTTAKLCYLKPLEDEFSSLFVAERTSASHGDWPEDLIKEAGMKIARKCGGVPLLLNYACILLCQPLGMQFWQGFLKTTDNMIHPDIFWRQVLAYIDDLPQDNFWQIFLYHFFRRHPDGNAVLDMAFVSYQHLPADLKHSFMFCSMFPLDYEFDAEELADLFIAKGYIPLIVSKAQRSVFVQHLLDDCFYPLQEREIGGKPRYRIHKLLHIFAQSLDKMSSTVRVDQPTITSKAKDQRSVRHAALILKSAAASFPSSLFESKDLRALILLQQGTVCPSDQPRCEIREIPQLFFQSFKSLQVLSIRDTKVRTFPTKFVQPHQVKYLDLSRTDVETIPSSISRLLFLQTLILSHCSKFTKFHQNTTKLVRLQKLDLQGCCNLVELPQNMSNMKSLEYLNVLDCSSLIQLPRGMGQLKNLHTLFGYIGSCTNGSAISELQALPNLHRLSLLNLGKVSDILDARNARLQHMTNLETLSMRWNILDDVDNSTHAYPLLETLQPHEHLETLEIVAYEGRILPSWITRTRPYLKSLKEIRLVNLRSCENVLPPLSLLPCLKIAEISGAETISSMNDNFNDYIGTFPSLEKLTFSYMHNLEVWEQEHRPLMFPRLAEVVIIQCPKWRALNMELPCVEKLSLWMDTKMLYGTNGGLKGLAKRLKHVSISFGEELLASSGCEGLQDLVNLKKLDICGCHELTCLPLGLQHLYSLTSLTIDNCNKLEAIPDWLEKLPSLGKIHLSGCHNLCFIPESLRFHTGIILSVEDCPSIRKVSSHDFPA